MVVRQGVVLTGAGLVAGGVLALGVARMQRGVLLGVEAGDPVTFLLAALALLGVALVANAVPARRAARVDPMVALRQD
jgi:putative ABC transport system permease protein